MRQCPKCGRKWYTSDTTKDIWICDHCGSEITREHEVSDDEEGQ